LEWRGSEMRTLKHMRLGREGEQARCPRRSANTRLRDCTFAGEMIPSFLAPKRLLFAAATVMGLGVAVPAIGEYSAPLPDHVVVVVMENHSFTEVMGADKAPYINKLATQGAIFANSFAVGHPSQPNYFALFTGATHGVEDNLPHQIDAPTLASSLEAKHRTFIGYVEHGSPRKHNPWESFRNSQHVERDLSEFPTVFTKLPTVSFVIPNLDNDMHDGSVKRGDDWLRRHLGTYAEWCARTNNLLIITFDEGRDKARQGQAQNRFFDVLLSTVVDEDDRILTVFFGGPVQPGRYKERIDHYNVLRTIEMLYDLQPLSNTISRNPIENVWRPEPLGILKNR
jgi:phosphatidylinositol-3-phosphatase